MKEAKSKNANKANVETIQPATEPTVEPTVETNVEPSAELGPVALVGGEYSPETSKDFSLDITYTEGTVSDFAAQSENQLAALENLKTAVKGMANGRIAIIAAVKAALATGCPVAIVRHTFVECWIANGGTKTYANEIMLGCGIRLRAVRKDAGKSKGGTPQAPANPTVPGTPQAPAVPGPVVTPPANGNSASVETPVVGTATVETPTLVAPVVSLETTKGLTAEAIGKSIATAIIAEHGRDKAKEIMRYLMAAVHAADASV